MHPHGGPGDKPASSSDLDQNDADKSGEERDDLMSNTSRVDVFDTSSAAPSAFESEVFPVAMSAVLHQGDLLFLPPGWWHAMRSLSRSFSVSMWF